MLGSRVFEISLICTLLLSKSGYQCCCEPLGCTIDSTNHVTFRVNATSDCSVIRNGSNQSNFSISLPASTHYDFTNSSNYSGYVINGVCAGANSFDPTLFEASSCQARFNSEANQLVFEDCDNGLVISGNCQIMITNCSTRFNAFILETIDCDAHCAMNRSQRSVFNAESFWKICPTVDLDKVSAMPILECRRQQCMRFLAEACSSCAMRCPEHIYYNVNASNLCPSHLVPSSTDMCRDSCGSHCLSCEGRGEADCLEVCENPSHNNFTAATMNNLCKDDIERVEIETFCANRTNCSNLLFTINCTSHPQTCDSICRREGLLAFYGKGCPSEVFQICAQYMSDLLSDGNVVSFIEIINAFINNVSPSVLVNRLQSLINDRPPVVLNDANIMMLLNVYDRLLSDSLESNWVQYSSFRAGSTVLLQLETLGKLISTDIIEGRRNNSFQYQADNLGFVVSPAYEMEPINQLTFTDKSSLMVALSVLCGNHINDNCSSVISAALINNLPKYLSTTSPSVLFSNGNPPGPVPIRPVSKLFSAQVTGVENFAEKLSNNPAQVTLKLKESINFGGCFFWNHTQQSWSDEGVFPMPLSNDTVMCSSRHLTSFAVLTIANQEQEPPFISPFSETERQALLIFDQISTALASVCFLATAVCLIFFMGMQIFKKVHLFIHFNLALSLFLSYFMYLVGIEHAAANRGACVFVAVWLHYFFLSSFSWMLCEGIMLFLLLVVVISELMKKCWFFLLIGYGLPIIPVILTLGIRFSDIGTVGCWLPFTNFTLLGFILPAMLILLVNIIFLVIALVKVFQVQYRTVQRQKNVTKGKTAENLKATKKLIYKLLISTIVLAPLLGLIWIFGFVVTFVHTSLAPAWIFASLTIIEGVLLFFFHVLRSDQLWKTRRGRRAKALVSKCLPKKKVSTQKTSSSGIKSDSNSYSTNASIPLQSVGHNSDLVSESDKDKVKQVSINTETTINEKLPTSVYVAMDESVAIPVEVPGKE